MASSTARAQRPSLWKRLCNWLGDDDTRPAAPKARPGMEELEQRLTPTVTYHGGPVLPHVEVQAIYYGSDWSQNSTLYQSTGQIESYLKYMVNSPYMDMLTNAGYGVGRGYFSQGRIVNYAINKSYYLNDSAIRSNLVSLINNHSVQAPDANRLYVIYIEPGVAVRMDNGATSINNFLGYHSSVSGVPYAVIPYQAGINAHLTNFSTFDSTTEVTSHELAEAVTDPLVNTRLAWYDNYYNGEIGDIVNGQAVRLNGYLVQKEAAKNDAALSPAGSTPAYTYSFASAAPVGAFSATTGHFASSWAAPSLRSDVLDVTVTATKGEHREGEEVEFSKVTYRKHHGRLPTVDPGTGETTPTAGQLADAVFAADPLR